MKQLSLSFLLSAFVMTVIMTPALASARDYDDDWDDDDDYALEVYADIYTDVTIVEVEQFDRKTVFRTEADTRAAIIDVVAARFNLSKEEVADALEIDVEDRASRPQDRKQLNRDMKKDSREQDNKNWQSNATSSSPVCRDDDRRLDIDVDVFTDQTVVEMEFVNAKDEVFTTSADTRGGVIDAILARYSTLTRAEVEAALDFDIEDRASRPSDLEVDDDCRNQVRATTTPAAATEAQLAELRARVAELQALLAQLIQLLRGN